MYIYNMIIFRDQNQNSDATDQWGIAFSLKGCHPQPFWSRIHTEEKT